MSEKAEVRITLEQGLALAGDETKAIDVRLVGVLSAANVLLMHDGIDEIDPDVADVIQALVCNIVRVWP